MAAVERAHATIPLPAPTRPRAVRRGPRTSRRSRPRRPASGGPWPALSSCRRTGGPSSEPCRGEPCGGARARDGKPPSLQPPTGPAGELGGRAEAYPARLGFGRGRGCQCKENNGWRVSGSIVTTMKGPSITLRSSKHEPADARLAHSVWSDPAGPVRNEGGHGSDRPRSFFPHPSLGEPGEGSP